MIWLIIRVITTEEGVFTLSDKNIIGANKCTGNTVEDITDGGTDTIFVAKIQTLTYTGNGAISYHIDTTIHPIYVRIWNRETVDGNPVYICETTNTIVDDHASGAAIRIQNVAVEMRINMIISLEADGFTVDDGGADEHPNKSGQVYNVFVLGY